MADSNFTLFQGVHSLVGWNSSALLFGFPGNGGGGTISYDVFATSSGAFGDGQGIPVGTIFNKSANDIPFGLQQVACFAEGTSIATPSGEIAIEDLKAGDVVLTASGAERPVQMDR